MSERLDKVNSIYLYDPKTNVKTPTNFEEMEKLTGYRRTSLSSMKTRKQKLAKIDVYLIDNKTTLKQRKELYSKERYKDEAWLTIDDTDGKYKISNYGRVKRLFKHHESFMLPYQLKGKGNLFVKIRFIDGVKRIKVGRLVAEYFIRKPMPGDQVIRKNGIITDDYVGNLRYVTKSELGKITGPKSRSKSVVQLDINTGEVIDEFRSIREAGRKCFLSHESVRRNIQNIGEPTYDFKFMYLEEYENTLREGIS